MRNSRKWFAYGAGWLALLALFSIGLDRLPPPWWDEGWSLTVARTWVERGMYARLLNGHLAPPGLEAAFPTTLLAAASMRVLGVGLAQARLEGVILTVSALGLLFFLTRQLFGRTASWWLLIVLFLMTMHPQMHVWFMGRQVLGEAALLLFLVGGFTAMLYCEKRPWLAVASAGLLWGVALISKAQTTPFFFVTLGGLMSATAYARQFRVTLWFGAAGALAYGVYRVLPMGLGWWMSGFTLPYEPVIGLLDALAFVLVPEMRLKALGLLLAFCLPLLCGVAYGFWSWRQERDARAMEHWLRLGLLIFVAAWLAWFLLLANSSIPRYVYPPAVLGAMFVAAMLDRFTEHFRLGGAVRRATEMLRARRVARDGLRALTALLLLALAVPFTLLMLFYAIIFNSNQDAYNVAAFLNSQTAPHARVESYEAELFFFLNRPYHYPPDQSHVEYIERAMYPERQVAYDALAADPDYLVVGEFGRGWQVYDKVLATGAFTPTKTFGGYEIYARVRATK